MKIYPKVSLIAENYRPYEGLKRNHQTGLKCRLPTFRTPSRNQNDLTVDQQPFMKRCFSIPVIQQQKIGQ